MDFLKTRLFPLLLLLGILPACSSSTHVLLTSSLPQYQTDYKKIAVYFQEPPRKARPLALFTVSRDGENALYAVEVMKMEAALLGADAITHLEMRYTSGLFPSLEIQGLAVKYVE